MVISKCVPLAISRKRFSDFLVNYEPQDMFFVGYKTNEEGKKVNVKMSYDKVKDSIKDEVIDYIKENGGIIVPPTEDDNP